MWYIFEVTKVAHKNEFDVYRLEVMVICEFQVKNPYLNCAKKIINIYTAQVAAEIAIQTAQKWNSCTKNNPCKDHSSSIININ